MRLHEITSEDRVDSFILAVVVISSYRMIMIIEIIIGSGMDERLSSSDDEGVFRTVATF